MSSIFDLFTDGTDGEPAFSGASLDAVLDDVISKRPVAGRPPGFDPEADPGSPAPSSDGEVHGAEGGEVPPALSPAPETPAAPPTEIPPAIGSDPLADLTDAERYEFSQLRQALNDPERAMAVRRAMLGVEAPPVPPPAPAPPVVAPLAPTLPEEFEPGTAEAQLWLDNQEMRAQLAEVRQGQEQQQVQTQQQEMNSAAQRVTASFAAKYSGKLNADEIAAICQHAGMQKLPEAFRPVSGSWDEAMTKSLDYVLRSNDVLLGKVLGATSAPPAAGQRTPEADARTRKLTALSSAASPSGDSPTRTPIEHRPDGKLTEKSRLQLVQEMMGGGGITGSPGEGI